MVGAGRAERVGRAIGGRDPIEVCRKERKKIYRKALHFPAVCPFLRRDPPPGESPASFPVEENFIGGLIFVFFLFHALSEDEQ